MKESEQMSSEDRTEFYSSVRQYYVKGVEYVLKKFPFHDQLLKHAEVVDVAKRGDASFESVKFFMDRFPCTLPKNVESVDDQMYDQIEEEFLKYQVDGKLDFEEKDRIDCQWAKMAINYPNLGRVMLGVLCIPHSNADSERVFSAVGRINTQYRPKLAMKTLESLVIAKTSMKAHGEVCHTRKFSPEVIKAAQSATYIGLSQSANDVAESEEETLLADVSDRIFQLLDDEIHDKTCK